MHTIRLRGPWQKTLLGDAQPVRTTVPESGEGHRVGAGYRRTFNCPTGLENARVYLHIENWGGKLDGVTLNDRQLPIQGRPFQNEVTDLLKSQNSLIVHLKADDQAAILDGEVYLSIIERDEDSPEHTPLSDSSMPSG